MKVKIVVIFLVFMASCSFGDEELKNGWWKYGGGAHIGDVLNFNNLKVRNQIIYRGEVAIGFIVNREGSFFGLGSRKIFIKPFLESEEYLPSLYDNGFGVYHQK